MIKIRTFKLRKMLTNIMKIFIKMSRTFKLRNMLTITIKIFIKVSLKNWKKKEKKVSI